ncbi:hypothetical protein BFP76_10675 [Amylibacter kogurei]|uniref:HPr kinase/phosphorylase C-terminal domain-containing protein n=1 Tax=Paramylibacter kogurei TaxID=1889778 RepID=A0A2G5KBF2_9RHOB|nr:hypothetical protein [Amylibacter kogurei]PIB26851.1 hypothetical protein BFP76_10675 [Amylibacter kogurei]
MYQYVFSGLRVSSEFKFTIADCEAFDGLPDVTIRFVQDLEKPSNPIYSDDIVTAAAGDVWFCASDELAYRVIGGSEILIARGKHVSNADVNLYLVGTGFGVLCLQRDLIPFHCSAVEHNGHAVAFSGESGVGKSTLAAALSQLGYGHVCDDVCIANPTLTPMQVQPMPKGLKLWDDAAAQLNIAQGTRVSADPDFHKSYVSVDRADHAGGLLFNRIYILDNDIASEFSVHELKGAEKHAELRRAIYREEWLHFLQEPRKTFDLVSTLASKLQVFAFKRPDDLARIKESAGILARHFDDGAPE